MSAVPCKFSSDAGLLANERHDNAVLARVYRKNGHTAVPAAAPMPFDALLAAEGGEDRAEILAAKEEAVMEFLTVLWSVGPKLAPVVKRLCAFTRMVRPELVVGMNRTEMAEYLGDKGRATHTAREHKLQEELRLRGGFRTLTLPDQKSESAREKSRNQARGNRNRCGGTRKQTA
ncbi:MAG: hypothetical protein H7343_00270 [Undibacterium sp.]|nr:hypothetical protein [Opitutaceae bacterium]